MRTLAAHKGVRVHDLVERRSRELLLREAGVLEALAGATGTAPSGLT